MSNSKLLKNIVCFVLLVTYSSFTISSQAYDHRHEAFYRMSHEHRHAVTLYTPSGEEITLRGADLKNLEESHLLKNPTLIIGNGGAGYVGLIKHLARIYNSQADKEDQIILGWKFADSNMNIRSILYGAEERSECDLYITYEPAIEHLLLEEGHLNEIHRLFNDEFPLIGPASNPAKLEAEADPLENIEKIVVYGLSLQERKPVYFSRWNNSAMGVKDQQLWVAACDRLAEGIMKAGTVEGIYSGLRSDLKERVFDIMNNGDLARIEKELAVSDTLLKEFTDYHVYKPNGERVFPAGAITASMELGLYAITDGGQLASNDIKEFNDTLANCCVIYNHGDKEKEDHILTNPGQLLVPKTFDCYVKDSPQRKFLNWLESEEGHNAISSFAIYVKDPSGRHPFNGIVEGDSFERALSATMTTQIVLARVNVGD